jgi:hypothetical protein
MNAMTSFASTAASPLAHLLQALRAQHPPQHLVHVGIGQGAGELSAWRDWPGLAQVILIDSDDTRLAWARDNQPDHWQIVHATVAPNTGPHNYYRASNPQEDGLVLPEQLKPWWPQLSTLGIDTRAAHTLDQLVPTPPIRQQLHLAPPPQPNHWLVIDCLPAARLLQGASQLLHHTSVVIARTSQAAAHTPLGDTGHQALVDMLAPLGFVVVGRTDTHHPALGYTLLARQHSLLSTAPTPTPPVAAPTPSPAAAADATSADQPLDAPTAAEPSWPEATNSPPPTTITTPQPTTTAQDTSLAELQAENNALRHRLTLLQEELLRAEGQINLIKDLMLRDQEL